MSPPKCVPDSVFRMFSLFDALVVVLEMCVLKVSERSRVMPRNFTSSTIGRVGWGNLNMWGNLNIV